MLRELSHIRQVEGAHPRRWFQSAEEDLVVWYAADRSIHGFQLCYNRTGAEKAVTWISGRGFSHHKVDAGERLGLNYARTPILAADGRFDACAMTRRFLEISADLPAEIREFVLGKLGEYPPAAPTSQAR